MEDGGAPLKDDDESAHWAACRSGDIQARQFLFQRYTPFADRIARKHYLDWTGTDLELTDLKQAAAAALLHAIDQFDANRGVPFSAFARLRIRGAVLDTTAKASEVREQVAAKARLRRERITSLHDLGAAIARDPLESLMDLAVGLALGFMLEGSSLYMEDNKPDPAPNAYDGLVWRELTQRLSKAVLDLPDRERKILRGHYALDQSFEEIGLEMGVSRSRISQIHKEALTRLRSNLTKPMPFSLQI